MKNQKKVSISKKWKGKVLGSVLTIQNRSQVKAYLRLETGDAVTIGVLMTVYLKSSIVII